MFGNVAFVLKMEDLRDKTLLIRIQIFMVVYL